MIEPPDSGRLNWRRYPGPVVMAFGAAIYLSLFWVNVRPWMPQSLRYMRQGFLLGISDLINLAAKAAGHSPPGSRWLWALISLFMGIVVPWVFMALIGRGTPREIGLRWPNRVGWRLIGVGYVVALPALLVMAWSPDMTSYYRRELTHQTIGQFVGTYMTVFVAEHFFFHGVLLALLRADRRWPVVSEPAAVEGSWPRKVARWVGLAQPTGDAVGIRGVARWIGLPDGCLWAMLMQSALFGWIHLGKAPAEFAFSFPGGLALAYVAYRCNSMMVPMVLHLATGLTTLGLIWLG